MASGSRVSRFVVFPTNTVEENSLSLSINWNQLQLGLLRSVDPNKQRHVAQGLLKPMCLGMKIDVILIVIQLTVLSMANGCLNICVCVLVELVVQLVQ